MTTKQSQPAPTPEDVRASLKEISALQKETDPELKEIDRPPNKPTICSPPNGAN